MGFTGDGTDCYEFDACSAEKPCYPGVECFPLGSEDFVCGACPAGKTGDGRSCVDAVATIDVGDVCSDEKLNPCFDKSMCRVNDAGNVSCVACPRGFKVRRSITFPKPITFPRPINQQVKKSYLSLY